MHPFHKSAEEELGDLSRSSVLELVAEIEWHKAAHQESIRHLQAEIERLRAAVRELSDAYPGYVTPETAAVIKGIYEQNAPAKQVGMDWELSDEAKQQLAEIDKHIKR